jgi:hypothetical protein
LYLAQKQIKGQTCYFIRESYSTEEYFLSRDLIDLGPEPGRFIIYPGGNSFYKELARQYRQKAQQLHPDKGGDHDKFVKLTEVYHELLRTKK